MKTVDESLQAGYSSKREAEIILGALLDAGGYKVIGVADVDDEHGRPQICGEIRTTMALLMLYRSTFLEYGEVFQEVTALVHNEAGERMVVRLERIFRDGEPTHWVPKEEN